MTEKLERSVRVAGFGQLTEKLERKELEFGGHAALEGEEDEVGAAAYTEFVEQVGDVKFNGAFGDVELAGDFLVGKIFQKRIENFLFAAAEIGDGIGFEAARLSGKDRVNETGKNGARNPEATGGDERKGADELVAGFGVGEDAFYAEAEQREAGVILMLFADDDEASVSVAFQDIGEESAGGLTGGMRVDHVNLGFGGLERAQVGSESRFELFADDFEFGFGQKAFELAQHQRVRREEANRELWIGAFRSHFG